MAGAGSGAHPARRHAHDGHRPAAGGRIAALASVDADGRRTDWLAPMPASCLRDGFDGLAWPKAGCYPLLPFSNRIRGGRFQWAGREVCLAPHPGRPMRCTGSRMHGRGRSMR